MGIADNAKAIANDPSKLAEFAGLNRIAVDAAQELLKRLMKEPEVAEAAEEFINSEDRSEDFKAYVAGESKGYKDGHNAGFAKGVAATGAVVGSLTLAAWAYLKTYGVPNGK